MGGVAFTKPRPLEDSDVIEGFRSGEQIVDDWLHAHGRKARKHGTAVVYASFADGRLAGFYTLSAQSITRGETREWIGRNAPQQIPVFLLGMLGVDESFQGQGLGRNLLLDAAKRAKAAAEAVGSRALVVDPANNALRAFYASCGFRDIPGTSRMFAKLW